MGWLIQARCFEQNGDDLAYLKGEFYSLVSIHHTCLFTLTHIAHTTLEQQKQQKIHQANILQTHKALMI